MKQNLKWCALAAVVMTVLSLMPQLHFWWLRGSQWNGAYATFQGDEFLYASYVNALIDGRPLRNDPPAGLDHKAQAPLPESLFSIQFVPSVAISFLARSFGFSASSAFIWLAGVTGLTASLSLYWLLFSVTADARFSGVGVLVVLCLGTLVAGEGVIGMFFRPAETSFLGFPFLRRYLPSAAFPLFFVFCTLVWQALSDEGNRATKAVLAGMVLCLLVFSYVFLWTTALAWLVCIAVVWFIMRRKESSRVARVAVIIAAMLIAALGYFAWLVSHLSQNADVAYVLKLTHQPDPFRVPEIIGLFVLAILFVVKRRTNKSWGDRSLMVPASFGLLPLIVFNQQVVTGRSLQPYHYEVFVVNYAVLIGLVLAARALYSFQFRQLVGVAAICILWGAFEVNLPFQARATSDVADDEMVPVLVRLRELSEHDGTLEGLRTNGRTPTLVFSPEIGVMRLLPTWAPQATLPEIGSGAFRIPSRPERKRVLFTYLYYGGHDRESLRKPLSGGSGDVLLDYYVQATLFGPERILPFLSHDFKPISNDELEKELNEYQAFLDGVSREEILRRPITYLITHTHNGHELSNVDRWYERDNGEVIGAYTLYRLSPRE